MLDKRKSGKWLLPGFTILEMLITLTIFSFTMIIVYNLMGMSVRILNRNFGGSSETTQSILFVKFMEYTLRDSYKITLESNGNFLINMSDERQLTLVTNTNMMIILEKKDDQWVNKKLFNLENIKNIVFDILGEDKRTAFRISMKVNRYVMNKTILLGYKKEE
ncbi:MAG: hypothetical protein A2355_16260 [Spirochaetes bacterium RIFOXYB1_FULL_32_8]|nr:MAG: hypothetical protein A2355_16260 [Spirochaetes bacterium RIFOXYB1_FULL_32_8]